MRGYRHIRSRDPTWLVPDDGNFTIDAEISHITKIQSEPCINHQKSLTNRWRIPVSTTTMLLAREANFFGKGRFCLADRSHILGRYLPVNAPKQIDKVGSEAYISQFSSDGSLLVAAFQGSLIKIYNVDKAWKVQKDINARSLRWTITDTALSPDQRHLVYSSLTPIVHIVNVQNGATDSRANITEIHECLDFSDVDGMSSKIYSIKFSNDGRELVAGSSNDSIYVYDLEANKLTLRLQAHTDDVNTVSFADGAGHVMYSGSDDSLCKVWDRRCYAATGKPAGVLEGHLEGITFIDSRGDGHYFISNGKDQTTKLWDIRRMSASADSYMAVELPTAMNLAVKMCLGIDAFMNFQVLGYSSIRKNSDFDYRFMDYPPSSRKLKHPFDKSVATYRGHSVLGTLIRCYFSPAHSTGQRYIYTGSYDNCVYIYDVVTGNIAAKLAWHGGAVRDCSWHPYYPMLVSSSWDCFVTRWEFPGNYAYPASSKKSRRRHQG